MTPAELTRWRESHGLSQAELARRLDVAPITVWRWENPDSQQARKPPAWLRFALPQIEQELKGVTNASTDSM